jgi:hypothetical protein
MSANKKMRIDSFFKSVPRTQIMTNPVISIINDPNPLPRPHHPPELHTPTHSTVLNDVDSLSLSLCPTELQSPQGFGEELYASTKPNDIGNLLCKDRNSLIDEHLLMALKNRYVPSRQELPFSEHVNQNKTERRYLGLQHFEVFPWLTVSNVPEFKGAWCLWCSLFKVSHTCGGWYGGGQPVGALVVKPLKILSKLTGKDGALTNHASTKYHQQVFSRVTEFLVRAPVQSQYDIRSILDSEREKLKAENRIKLRPIVDTILTCARQNIPLRGHRDSGPLAHTNLEDHENDGNFRSLLRMRIRAGDNILQNHIENCSHNAQYISPRVQNEILDCASKLLIEKIVVEANNAKVWSLLADETMDRKKREQLVLVLRYVIFKEDKVSIHEAPVCLLDLLEDIKKDSDENNEIRMTGKNIGKSILNKVKSLGLDLNRLVGQGYDGAANMSSEKVGASAEVMKCAPMALFFHCAMHLLNLCATETSRVPCIRDCLDTLQELSTFFNSSAKRVLHLQDKIKKSDISDTKRTRLISNCQTRFVERHEMVLVAISLFPYIISALEDMTTEWENSDTRKSASSLLRALTSFDFILAMNVLSQVCGILRPATRAVQEIGLDIVRALDDINRVKDVLLSWRENSDIFHREVFSKAVSMAESIEVEVKKPRVASRCVYRGNSTNGNDSVGEYYRLNVYLPLLDNVTTHLNDRFGPKQTQVFHLSRLVPSNIDNSTYEEVHTAAEFYETLIELDQLSAEFQLWKHQWQGNLKQKSTNTAVLALEECPFITLPNIHILLCILTTLPVSTAQPERVFSKVNILILSIWRTIRTITTFFTFQVEKTLSAARTVMTEDRLESLILIQTHREKELAFEEVIDKFASSGSRRILL